MENGLPAEFRPLFNTRLQEDAKDARVIWAKVKGYPWWPVSAVEGSVGQSAGFSVQVLGHFATSRAGPQSCPATQRIFG